MLPLKKMNVAEAANIWKERDKSLILPCLLSLLWLCLIGWLAFFWNLGNTGLIDETEPLFAEAARQMTVTGDWITPYFNGETRFDKPPGIYWLMAIAYGLVGVNEWAVRLPSAIAAIALVSFGFYTLYSYGHYSLGDRGAKIVKKMPAARFLVPWIGAATMAFNPETITWGRIGVSDMLLTGFMCSALLAFFLGYAGQTKREHVTFEANQELIAFRQQATGNRQQGSRVLKYFCKDDAIPTKTSRANRWYLAFYILSAFAVLAKGPVGIVLPVLIIGSFLLYVGKFREVWQEIRPFLGSVIFLEITLPWYVLVTARNGKAYIESFFGYHNFERFTSVVNHHAGPWYFYFLVVLVGFAPWSIYLPVAIAKTQFWQRRYWSRQPRQSHLGLFALFWFSCIFIFFTIAATKLISYVLPLMPAAAILTALFWGGLIISNNQRLSELEKVEPRGKNADKFFYFSGILNAIFLLVLALAILISFQWLDGDPSMPNFPEAIQQSGLLISGSLILLTTALLLAFMVVKRQISGVLIVNFLGLVAFLIFAIMPTLFLVDSQRQLPLRELAETIVRVRQPGEEVVMIGFEKPSLVFYTQNRVNFFRRATNAREFLDKISERDNSDTVVIIGYPQEFVDAGLQLGDYQYLDRGGPYLLGRVSKELFVNSKNGVEGASQE
ncbi:MAG: glycosyltransferase family 39 protein [Cyanobacteriota bacterium]|nr:glycosyltransferase family 39 protein [Cyanobacteriota bacterium]